MKCAACGTTMEAITGEVDLRINGELFIVRNVPFEECKNCGERVLPPEVAERIHREISQGRYRRQQLDIAVLESA